MPSVALTGSHLTSALGSLGSARSLALIGNAIAAHQGSVPANASFALTGGALDLDDGAISPAASSTIYLEPYNPTVTVGQRYQISQFVTLNYTPSGVPVAAYVRLYPYLPGAPGAASTKNWTLNRVSVRQATASEIQALTANTTVTAVATSVTSLTATVANNTASIVTAETAIANTSGQLNASYVLTASAGNAISGMRLLSSSNATTSVSEVIFNANSFQIYNGTNTLNLFSVVAGTNNLANVSINGDLLVAGTVTATALDISEISAISTNLGSPTSGTIAIGAGEVEITSGSGNSYMKISGGLLTVYDASGNPRVYIGGPLP